MGLDDEVHGKAGEPTQWHAVMIGLLMDGHDMVEGVSRQSQEMPPTP